MGASERGTRTAGDDVAEVVAAGDVEWDDETDVLVAGGGGTGLTAALAASEGDCRVAVFEKAADVGGNTSLSTGMIPAAGTRMQREAGIEESPADMVRDVMEKNGYRADEERVRHLCAESAALIHWLVDDWAIDLHLVDDFTYPKHSEYRMHAPPGRNGENLIAQLSARAASTSNVTLRTEAPVVRLVADDGAVVGAVAEVGGTERVVAADAVILATDGFAGNRRMVATHCPDIESAYYFGSEGNTGDGIRFGAALGGDLARMDAYQAHATVARRTDLLSTYAVIMNGGIVVNRAGERFGDETKGYSAFAVDVLEQPDGVGYEVFDAGIYESLRGEFDSFDEAIEAGTYVAADDVATLAGELGCAPDAASTAVRRYNEAVDTDEPDEVGRVDGRSTLDPPFYGTEITGALFHTQGGLQVDDHGRVLRTDGTRVANLYAGGGAAAGISGHGSAGYLSGNGLTTALGYGRLAGAHAAGTIERE